MSSFTSDDEVRDELEIKPPQAHVASRREKRREKDKYHRSKQKDYREEDRGRSRGDFESSQQGQRRVHRSRGYEGQSGRDRPYPRPSEKPSGSGSRSGSSSSHHRKPGSEKYSLESSSTESKDDRRSTLKKKEEKRKYIEEEEQRIFASISKRNEMEKRLESRKVEAKGRARSSSPEPSTMEVVDDDAKSHDESPSDEKTSKSFLPFEVEDIEESSSDMEEGEKGSVGNRSHSDISASEDEKSENGKDNKEGRTPNSVISDESSASPSGASGSKASSKSSDSEKEEQQNGSADNGSKIKGNKTSVVNSPNGKNRSAPRSPQSTTGAKDNRYPHGNSETIEVVEATDVLSLLPPYYPAIQGCRRVEEFHLLNRIEEGTYGVVYRAKDKRTNEIVALKKLKMEKEKDGFPITSLREINTLLKAQHENIVTVREIVVGSNTDKIYLVMDYVEHDLKSLMETLRQKEQAFMMGEVKCLMIQLLRAVAHLHDNWILHRDLKTSNLLLSHKGILKVGDFGLAREYGSPLKAYTSIVVTLWYRAPELLLGQKEYSTPIDVWSVGCIFGELLKMEPMFQGKSEPNQLNLIFQTLGTPNDRIWPDYSQLPLLQRMTFADYPLNKLKTRFNILSEAGIDLMNKFLTFNPAKRITAEDALKHPFFEEPPLPIDPSVFPTWPAKSESGHRMAPESPKPPSGGRQFKDLRDEDGDPPGFFLGDGGRRQGAGFNLKF